MGHAVGLHRRRTLLAFRYILMDNLASSLVLVLSTSARPLGPEAIARLSRTTGQVAS